MILLYVCFGKLHRGAYRAKAHLTVGSGGRRRNGRRRLTIQLFETKDEDAGVGQAGTAEECKIMSEK